MRALTSGARPDFTRQLDIVNPDKLSVPITIIGAGGIGSPTAFELGKMGCSRITVIDFDVVEAHNLPSQRLYRPGDVGMPKVRALTRVLRQFGIRIAAEKARVGEGRTFEGIVVMAVDSMASRRTIFTCVRFDAAVELVIDGRMGATTGYVFTFDPRDSDAVRAYEELSAFSDEEAEELPCTARAVIFVPSVVAAVIARITALWANDWRPQGLLVSTVNFDAEPIVATDTVVAEIG